MITVSDIRKALSLPPSEDERAKALRLAVIAQFEQATGKRWNACTGVEETRSVDRLTQSIYIHAGNVCVTEVKQWNRAEEYDGEVLDPATEDDLGEYTVIRKPSHFYVIERTYGYFEKNVKITYDCGWTTLPDSLADVKEALLQQARFLNSRFLGDRLYQQSLGFEGGNTAFITDDQCTFFKAVAKRRARKL